MFRMLWEEELFAFIPDHPEMRGEFEIQNGDSLTLQRFADKEGDFCPICTSDAVADYIGEQLPKPLPAIAAVKGEVLFRLLNDGQTTVRVQGPKGVRVVLKPEAVAEIVSGELRHNKGNGGETRRTTLHPVPVQKVPSKLREGIRVFCAKRRVPIGVYVFHPEDPETGTVVETDWRIVVWLRSNDTDFYNDFALMVKRLTPHSDTVYCTVITDNTEAVAFLQGRTPLWPITQ